MTDQRPLPWVEQHGALLPPSGQALDLACGSGRHSVWLATRGLRVLALDRDQTRIDALARHPLAVSGRIVAERRDLESGEFVLPADAFDVIVVTHYLHRLLLPQIVAGLRRRGLLIYETFTTAQAARGKPTNPAFLLAPGELLAAVAPLDVVDWREGDFDGRMVASVVARRG